MFLTSSLLGHMAHAQPPMTGLNPKPRQLVVPAVAEVRELEVRVAPGHLTSVTFHRPLTAEGVKVEGGRERLKRLDVSETHLTLEPAAEVGPGSPLRLTVRFPDGFLPEQVVLVLVTRPSQEVDTQVEVSRLPSTLGEVLAELNATRARLAEARQQLQAQRPDCAVTHLTERMFSALGEGAGTALRRFGSNPDTQLGVEYLRGLVHRASERSVLGLRFRVTASAHPLAPWTPGEVHLGHRSADQQFKVLSLEVRPPRFVVGDEVVVVLEVEPLPPFHQEELHLRFGTQGSAPFLEWEGVRL